MLSRSLIVPFLLSSLACAQTWSESKPSVAPTARHDHSMAWDSARGKTVMFGGYNVAADKHYQDTWEYDGSNWQMASPATMPPARRNAGMCFDERRGVTVLFGGTVTPIWGNASYLGDTWEYDGKTWRKINFAGAVPSPRYASLSYDSLRGVVVMFGGYGDTSPNQHSDTWEYDGSKWMLRTPTVTPNPGFNYTSAFDRKRGRTILHPGYIAGHSTQMITWEWDGTNWTQGATLHAPFPNPSMCYDSQRERIVMVGANYAYIAETWEYDGAAWTQVTPSTLPITGLSKHRLVYDEQQRATVLFGGEKDDGFFRISSKETWEFATQASFEVFGSGCTSNGRTPILEAASGSSPRSGTTLTSEVSRLASGDSAFMILGFRKTTWQGSPLPADLAWIGLPGCKLRTSVDAMFALSAQSSTASWSVPIPVDPRLHGAVFYQQALIVDATGSSARGVTNAAELTIGH